MIGKMNKIASTVVVLLAGWGFLDAARFVMPGDPGFTLLQEKAAYQGRVRIVVHFEVPGLEQMTAWSGRFRSGSNDTDGVQQAVEADRYLDQAISVVRNRLLSQVQTKFCKVNRTYSTLPYIGLTVDPRGLDQLKCLPDVLGITEDLALPAVRTRPDVMSGNRDGVARNSNSMAQDSIHLVGADLAWGYGYTGAGWTVAILDTGIRASHEMFGGKTIVEQCFASGPDSETTGPGDCPNGLNEMSGPGSARHFLDESFHGTHVAGIAAGNNHSTHFGVAKDAGIIAINVFSFFPEYNDVMSWTTDQLKGLEFVYLQRLKHKIAAVNISIGSGNHDSPCNDNLLKPAIDNLRTAGIATVISSGNEAYCGSLAAPACISSAVAVGGTNMQDQAYDFGNWDSGMVSLLAPGVSISSAAGFSDTGYINMSGTSMSAPHVAGAWAILKQYNENFAVKQLLNIFKTTGIPIAYTRCSSEGALPRLQVAIALESVFHVAPPRNVSASQVENQTLLMIEYINRVTWAANPINNGKNLVQYKVYQVQGAQKILLATVDAGTFAYLHRGMQKDQDVTYSVSSVDGDGYESPGADFLLQFKN